jgi:F-type H+-transporting ATPase subunit b
MHITRISRTALTALCVCGIVLGLAAFGFAEEAQHAAAGHEGGHGAAQMKDFIWRCVDFAALVVIAVWAVKKADVKGTLAARSTGIKRTLEEAVAAKEAAEKKFQEYNTRMDQANKEIEEISANMKREGQLEKERIIAEANQAAARIVAQAETAAAQEVLKAKGELRAEAAKLAVELAEQKITKNIAKGDQDKLVGDYISKVVTLH